MFDSPCKGRKGVDRPQSTEDRISTLRLATGATAEDYFASPLSFRALPSASASGIASELRGNYAVHMQ